MITDLYNSKNINNKWCGFSSLYDIIISICYEIKVNRNTKSVFGQHLYKNLECWYDKLSEFINFINNNNNNDFINEFILMGPHRYDEFGNTINLLIAPDNMGKLPLKKANISLKTKLLINRIDFCACKIFGVNDPELYRKNNTINNELIFEFYYNKTTSDIYNLIAKNIFNLWEFFNETKIDELFIFFKEAKEIKETFYLNKNQLSSSDNLLNNTFNNSDNKFNNSDNNIDSINSESNNLNTPQVIILGNLNTSRTWDLSFNNINKEKQYTSNNNDLHYNEKQRRQKDETQKKYYNETYKKQQNNEKNNKQNDKQKDLYREDNKETKIMDDMNDMNINNLTEEERDAYLNPKGWKQVGKTYRPAKFNLTNRLRK